MKKTVIFLFLTISALFWVSCSSSNSPEAVAKKAIAAIQKGDYEAYAATFDLSSSGQKMLAGMAEVFLPTKSPTKEGSRVSRLQTPPLMARML